MSAQIIPFNQHHTASTAEISGQRRGPVSLEVFSDGVYRGMVSKRGQVLAYDAQWSLIGEFPTLDSAAAAVIEHAQ